MFDTHADTYNKTCWTQTGAREFRNQQGQTVRYLTRLNGWVVFDQAGHQGDCYPSAAQARNAAERGTTGFFIL